MTTERAFSLERSRSRQKGLLVFSFLIMGYIGFQFGAPGPEKDLPEKMPPLSGVVIIELNGLVHRPGVMTYGRPPTLQKVIQDGGGLSGSQSLTVVQRQETLNQNVTLTVTEKDKGTIALRFSPLSVKALWIIGKPIPVNRAALEDLIRLPGLGPKIAERVIAYRETVGGFTALDQLKEVKGIKEKTFEKIKGHFIL